MSQDTSHLTFGAYLKAYFKQCLEVFKHPKMLLPTVILAVVWIGLGILQNKVGRNLPLSILNFLTYAQGGLYGGILGAIGGILGKIVVVAFVNMMFAPLFYKKNPFANFKQGFKEMIANIKFESKDAAALLLKGSGTALLLYSIFNVPQLRENSLVGIVSVVALISAVARKQGFLWGLVISFMNSISKGKVPSYQRVVRVLTGMTLGFTLGVALSTVGFVWVGLLGIIALIVGLILGKNNSKKTVTTTVLMLLFLLPRVELFADSAGVWKLIDVKTETNPTTKEPSLTATISGTTNSWRIDYSWENGAGGHVVGQFYGSLPPFQGSYAPDLNCLGSFEMHQEHRPSNLLIWPLIRCLNITWKIYYGKDRDKVNPVVGRRYLDNGDFCCTFPTLDEAGSEYIIVEEEVELRKAYIRTLYYFKWDAKGKAGNNSSSTDGKWITFPRWIDKLFGTDGHHTPDSITILIVILSVLGGLGGGLGGALGGDGNAPTGEGPTGGNDPTPEELEGQRYQKEKQERFNKYVHDNPDGTKTYTDPATGEKHTLYPKYNSQTGEADGWMNENDTAYTDESLNEWLAWRERNSDTFAQDAAQAQRNLEEQRAMNEAQNDYDRERGSSVAADAHKAFKEQSEYELRLHDLAMKHGLSDSDKDSLKKALIKERHQALEEGAEAMKDAAFWNDAVNYAETTERIADTTISVMGEFPGNRGVKNIYTVVKSIVKHGTESKVKGDSVWAGIAQGAAEGGLGVLQNQEMTGVFGTSALGKLAKAGVNIGAESAKSVINDLMDPDKSASEILDNATNAAINRIYYEGTGTIAKTYGEAAADATASGVDKIGSFAQEMGFHTDSANALADEINKYRHVFFRI